MIHKVNDPSQAVTDFEARGLVVEYGTVKKPHNALIYFSHGPCPELWRARECRRSWGACSRCDRAGAPPAASCSGIVAPRACAACAWRTTTPSSRRG